SLLLSTFETADEVAKVLQKNLGPPLIDQVGEPDVLLAVSGRPGEGFCLSGLEVSLVEEFRSAPRFASYPVGKMLGPLLAVESPPPEEIAEILCNMVAELTRFHSLSNMYLN